MKEGNKSGIVPTLAISCEDFEKIKNSIEEKDKEIEKLKSNINKAIKYIEEHSLYEQDYDYDYEENLVEYPPSDEQAKKDLLDILMERIESDKEW